MLTPKIHITLVANERYRPGLEVTKRSMIDAAKDAESLCFHEYGDEEMVPFLARVPLENYNGSKLPYLRLFLPELLPELDWIIYSDVDTIWDLDPAELWKLRDDTKAICWVKDLDTTRMEAERWARSLEFGVQGLELRRYACSGVCLINLKKWREEGITEKCLNFLRKRGCPPYADQDVLNIVLKDDAKLLPQKWDRLIPPYFGGKCVYHITGIGRHFQKAEYDGLAPQYALWFKRSGRPYKQQKRWLVMTILGIILLPIFAALDALPGPFGWKVLLMRLRRQLGFAKTLLGERD